MTWPILVYFSSQRDRYGTLSTAFDILVYCIIIMCGYQCDKAWNKNDTHEVIIYDNIISLSEMISYHFTGLNGPIK